MTDQQQRLADIENGIRNEVPFENDAIEEDSSSPASAYRNLYNRMSSSQQANAALSSVSDHGLLRVRTSSSTTSCSTLGQESEDEIEDDCNVPPPALPVNRTLSAVSNVTKRYDLTGKGYLDDTEKAMRALDTSNRGTLDMKKVYIVMKEMQQQQTALHEQQKSFGNLRKVVIVLSCFSMVLALANLGTAFVAATLAKDMTVDTASGALLAKGSGESISTVSTGGVIHVEELTEPESVYDRRNLRVVRRAAESVGRGFSFTEQAEELLCPQPPMGEVRRDEVEDLIKQIDNSIQYVNFKYKFEDSVTNKKTRSQLSLHIEESNYDVDNGNLHIRCTRTFNCVGEDCQDGMIGQFRLAPEDFSFQPIRNGKKYGLFSCHSSGPLDLTGDNNLREIIMNSGDVGDGGI